MSDNGYATRDVFLTPGKRRFRDVELPVSGLKLRIRSLMEGEKSELEATFTLKDGRVRKDARRRLVAACLVDGNGDPLLSRDDIQAMERLDGADLSHLQAECMVHCGYQLGELEASEKNSGPVRDADSPTV